MIDRIYNYMVCNKMIGEGSRILAAVSGGADSMCLLEVLRELQNRAGLHLRVLHVHHGLRESAEGDLEYVSKYCSTAGISFKAVRVDAAGYAAQNGLSLEEAARHLRYAALQEAAENWDQEIAADRRNPENSLKQSDQETAAKCQNQENSSDLSEQEITAEHSNQEIAADRRTLPLENCRIAVAHHMEDQAETVLFNLVRGSRLKGLRGMLPVNGRIIRPLLECSRGEIEAFLEARGVLWRQDETNEDVRYARNLLRHEVMPLLEQINAGAVLHIARAAEEAAETEAFLQAETERAAASCRIEQAETERAAASCRIEQAESGNPPEESHTGRTNDREEPRIISILALLREPPLLQRRVVYAAIAEVAGRKKDLQGVHVLDVLKLAQKKGNGRLDVFGGVQVEKMYDKLIFAKTDGASQKQGAPEACDMRQVSSCLWPADAAQYSCRVLDFDGDLAAVSRKQYTKWLDYDKIGALPNFRTRREGDRITLDESGRSKTLARYMIDAKVPAKLRDRIVLPMAGSEVLWVPAGWEISAQPEAGSGPEPEPAGKPAQREARSGSEPEPAGKPAQPGGANRSSDSGRISAAYLVDSDTRRILEIRWAPPTG